MSTVLPLGPLGPNPVDTSMAFRSAVESSLDLISSGNECVENARDWGNKILVTLEGQPIKGRPGFIRLESMTIEDDGCGMDIITMAIKFRGAFFNSESHGRTDQSGRNGVGVKTNLQYWKKIHVETTTKSDIPLAPDDIKRVYYRVSSLRAGDRDTEIRCMDVTMEGAELTSFKTCLKDDSFTKVTLLEPREDLCFNTYEFIRRLSHSIEWLENSNHELIVHYRSDENRSIRKRIRPFYEIDKKDEFICHVKGNSHQDMHILYQMQDGTQQSLLVPAYTGTDLEPMDMDIKVLDRDPDPQSPTDFVISICGAQIYDRLPGSSGSVAPAAQYLTNLYGFTQAGGFSRRLHGYIKTKDDQLKKALRHNKSVLDQEDKYTKAFQEYLVEHILKPLNVKYVDFTRHQSNREDQVILDEICKTFNGVMLKVSERQRQRHTPNGGGGGNAPTNKEYRCNRCGLIWRVPLDKDPSYCAEFSVDEDKRLAGCGKRDFSRNTHAKNDPGTGNVKFEWKDYLGRFLPAEYDPAVHTIYLAACHPSFITELTGARERDHKITVGIEKAFFAKACYESGVQQKPITDVYSELLKEWFESRSVKDPLKTKCRKFWREKGVEFDQI